MAIIENKTAESIKNNGELLLTISRERIWDEFKKSWVQSKDFRDYLGYLKSFELYKYIFPGAKINTDLVESKDFVVVIANLFKKEKLGALRIGSNLENKLVQDYKMESDLAKKVVFLISFLNFRPEDVFDFYKKKQQSGIDDSTILEWLDVNNINDEWMIKFVNYKPTVSSKDLMDKGFKGPELGREIKRLEIENFKSK